MAGKYPISAAPNAGWDKRVIVVQCGDLVNAFIVVTTRYVILIDTLINPRTASVMLDIAAPYLSSRQLLVINTHADYDHCWGNQIFAGKTPIIATVRCAERLKSSEARQTLSELRVEEPGIYDDVLLTPPTLLFDHHFQIDGGDLTLDLFATPGHQPDHISIYVPEIGLLFPGDAAEFPFPSAQSAQTIPQLRLSIEQMIRLNPAGALYCHAPLTAGPAVLQQNLAFFATLEHHCREAIRRGVPKNPPQDADIPALISLPLSEAVPSSMPYSDYSIGEYPKQCRLMLEYVGGQRIVA